MKQPKPKRSAHLSFKLPNETYENTAEAINTIRNNIKQSTGLTISLSFATYLISVLDIVNPLFIKGELTSLEEIKELLVRKK